MIRCVDLPERPGYSTMAHAWCKVGLFEELFPLVTGELATLVRCPAAVCLHAAKKGMEIGL